MKRFAVWQKAKYRMIDPAIACNRASLLDRRVPIPAVHHVVCAAAAAGRSSVGGFHKNPSTRREFREFSTRTAALLRSVERVLHGATAEPFLAYGLDVAAVCHWNFCLGDNEVEKAECACEHQMNVLLVDAHKAYNQVAVKHEHQKHNCFVAFSPEHQKFFAFKAKTMIFGNIHSVSSWILTSAWVAETFSIFTAVDIRVYVDDFIIYIIEMLGGFTRDAFSKFLTYLGIAHHPDKTHLSRAEEALGIVVCFRDRRVFVSIASDKRTTILGMIDVLLRDEKMETRTLASLVGKAQSVLSASRGVRANPLVQPIRAVEVYARNRKWKVCGKIGINQTLALKAIQDIVFKNVPVEVIVDPVAGAADYTIISDASWTVKSGDNDIPPRKRFGWVCAIVTSLKGKFWKMYFQKVKRADIAFKTKQPITFLEAVVPVVTCTRCRFPCDSSIRFFLDNHPALCILQRNAASTPQSTILALSFNSIIERFKFRVALNWVPSKLNLADCGTRPEYLQHVQDQFGGLFDVVAPFFDNREENDLLNICSLARVPFVSDEITGIFRRKCELLSEEEKNTSDEQETEVEELLYTGDDGTPELQQLLHDSSGAFRKAVERMMEEDDDLAI